MARLVIRLVQEQEPPGRFLEKVGKKAYKQAPKEKVVEKVCQSLREQTAQNPFKSGLGVATVHTLIETSDAADA